MATSAIHAREVSTRPELSSPRVATIDDREVAKLVRFRIEKQRRAMAAVVGVSRPSGRSSIAYQSKNVPNAVEPVATRSSRSPRSTVRLARIARAGRRDGGGTQAGARRTDPSGRKERSWPRRRCSHVGLDFKSLLMAGHVGRPDSDTILSAMMSRARNSNVQIVVADRASVIAGASQSFLGLRLENPTLSIFCGLA